MIVDYEYVLHVMFAAMALRPSSIMFLCGIIWLNQFCLVLLYVYDYQVP
jgi:hypothetical protein